MLGFQERYKTGVTLGFLDISNETIVPFLSLFFKIIMSEVTEPTSYHTS